ncbi:CAP domain-containing protein [Streptomyces beijiangensis]|uniref:TerD family protein n=1 Tax=Streptomyces beijiangensis TaxID=163361 RepID=A0A939F6L4_9ACTN|nr:CAP domain-containing protein [Streptomyces beijiangensis]MBO0512801.1 TerD family protein [Streptomyces beijiangensis]
MSELVPGGNLALPGGVLTIHVPGPFDLSVLITDDSGKVGGDADFVFYNQPTAPGARLGEGTVSVDPGRLRTGASRVTVVISPADPGTSLGRLPSPALRLSNSGGQTVATFNPPRPTHETVLLLAEIYRRGTGWKLRALGQGYADGLAGIARDFGVDVAEDATAETVIAVPASSPAPDGLLGLVNADRSGAGAPPVRLDPRLTAAAQAHAAGMAGQDRLSVEGPDGVSVYQRVSAQGYAYLTIDEHLVSGPRTPAEFIDYCRGDTRTRRALRDPALTDAGFAHVGAYWTALWARPFTAEGLARTASEVVALTNSERSEGGLRPLSTDPRLTAAAQAYSTDMAGRGFYSHTSPEGLQPWDRAAAAGAVHRGIGENIACGQRTAPEVVLGWMNSPGHRANILKPDFTHIGIGFAGGGLAGTYWTQLFGMSG